MAGRWCRGGDEHHRRQRQPRASRTPRRGAGGPGHPAAIHRRGIGGGPRPPGCL